MKAPEAFSSVKLVLYGVKVNLGADVVNYAFIRMAPKLASHHCPIEATSSRDVCGCDNEFTLQHNPEVENSGVLSADLSQLNIYYAYVNDASQHERRTSESRLWRRHRGSQVRPLGRQLDLLRTRHRGNR